jgi:cell division protein ZapE
MPSVTELYHQILAERGFTADPAQLRAVAMLQRCQDEWAAYKARRGNALTKALMRPPIPRGVYMFGGVGRGKSFLMDCFFQAVPLQRKTRLHFHEFMREVHRELQELKGTVNPLDELGKRIARRYRLICFDEFHVADVTDAMILHRLLESLFANRVSIVTTSNFHPDGLYPNGLHRDRILPAIELLKAKLEVANVDNGTDYRRRTLEQVELYHCPLGAQADAAMQRAFEELAECSDEDPLLHIEHRELPRAPQGRQRGLVRLQGPCAAVRAHRTTTSKSPPSSTPCCCPTCRRCRPSWPARRAASPGWWTCSTTGASNWSSLPPCRPRSSTPRVRWPTNFPAPSRA